MGTPKKLCLAPRDEGRVGGNRSGPRGPPKVDGHYLSSEDVRMRSWLGVPSLGESSPFSLGGVQWGGKAMDLIFIIYFLFSTCSLRFPLLMGGGVS